MYRTSDYPKDKVSFSPNEVEEQSVTYATRAKPSVSHEDIEAGQAIDEAEVEEDEEEYDTDSDSDDPTADSDEDNWELKQRRRRRQRERHKTIGLISKNNSSARAFDVLYISLPSCAKQQREMTKFKVLWRT